MAKAEGRLPKQLKHSEGAIFGDTDRGLGFAAEVTVSRAPVGQVKLLERTFAEQLKLRYNQNQQLRLNRLFLRAAAKRVLTMATAALDGEKDPLRMLRKIQIEAERTIDKTGGQ